MDGLITIIQILILLFSITLHEVAHGAMAEKLGDKTAKEAGRLTLNPLKHLDPFGSVILPLMLFLFKTGFMIGWAKPVPVNPYNFRDQKYGQAKVALAGPLSNLAVALFFGFLLRFAHISQPWFLQATSVLIYIVYINLLLALFNLTPLPPFDGSHILFTFLPQSANAFKEFLLRSSFILLAVYIFFIFPLVAPVVRSVFQLITGIGI